MNDQISADLQRLIGRVWMAAYEEGKREALAPKDPDTMRREALAAALAQDGADERVRADWTAVGDGATTEFPVPAADEPVAPVNTTPIRRSDVRLKVGDVVARRDGEVQIVTSIRSYGSFPVMLGDGIAYLLNGHCYLDSRENPHCNDIVTINNHPIIED